MKTLIILAHPNFDSSIINKGLIEAVKDDAQITIHNLCEIYKNSEINAIREQNLINEHSNLILQFPLFNFAPPAILKQWIDSVMTYGFAYGSHSQGMKNRNVGVVVSAGIKKGDYSPNGRYHFEMSEILAPLELAFKYYFKASYRGFYAIYGKEEMPGVDYEVGLSQNDLDGYLKFIRSFN